MNAKKLWEIIDNFENNTDNNARFKALAEITYFNKGNYLLSRKDADLVFRGTVDVLDKTQLSNLCCLYKCSRDKKDFIKSAID